jgi:hypothetical protein
MRRLSSAVVLATVLLASCQSSDPVEIKFNLQPGSRYRYTTDTKQEISQTFGGSEMKMQQDMNYEMTYDVKGAAGGQRDIAITYTRIAMKSANPMGTLEWDSKDPSKQNPILKPMGSMVNKTFTMTATENGEIVKLDGLQNILSSAMDTNNPAGSGMQEQMNQSFSDSALRQMMQQSLQFYPGKAVRPGDSWKRTMTMAAGPLSLTLDNTYKLKSVSGGKAKVEVDTKIAGKPGGAGMAQGMSIDLKGSQDGTMNVDISSGLLEDAELKQHLKGATSVNGMNLPMRIESTVTMKGEKL